MFEDGQRARDGAEPFALAKGARTPREGAVACRASGRLVASYARGDIGGHPLSFTSRASYAISARRPARARAWSSSSRDRPDEVHGPVLGETDHRVHERLVDRQSENDASFAHAHIRAHGSAVLVSHILTW